MQKSRLKVLLINNCAPIAGIGVYSFSLFRVLQQRNDIQVDMVCTDPIRVEDTYGKIKFLSNISNSSINQVLNYFINPFKIHKQYDVYHITSHGLSMFANFIHPSLVTVHDLLPFRIKATDSTLYKNPLLSAVFHTFFKRSMGNLKYADFIIANSEFTKSELIKILKVNAGKIEVIYHGIDHNLFRPRDKILSRKKLALPLNKKIVLNVGDEMPRKNVSTLVKAFYRLLSHMRDVVLVRVGPERDEIQKLIRLLKIESFILRRKRMKNVNNFSLYYNAADILVYPSLYEGFGLPLLEAMACGCPTIAGDIEAIREVSGGVCILVDPNDVGLLSSKMKEILENEKLRSELTERGLKRALKFSWENCAEKTVKLYEKISYRYNLNDRKIA